jgi:hypothetical protein
VDHELGAGADRWTRKTLSSEAMRAVLAPAPASARCAATMAAASSDREGESEDGEVAAGVPRQPVASG